MYDWDDSGLGDNRGNPDHVGVVEQVVGGTITIIEGNKGGAVARRKLAVNGRYIRGYCTPDYAGKAEEDEKMLSYEQWKEYMDRYRKELAAKESTMPALVADAVALGISSDGSRPGDLMTREEGMVMARAAAYAAQK